MMLVAASLTVALGQPPTSGAADPLAELRAGASGQGRFEPPDAGELGRAEALFARTLARGEGFAVLEAEWASLGFVLRRVDHGPGAALALMEAAGRRTGRGFYVFRDAPGPELGIEAPHAPSDLGTGELTLRLYRATRAAAAAWSTLHRREVDLAHIPGSHFHAFSVAFARVFPAGRLVQVHGFDAERPATSRDREAGVVVSNGTKHPGPSLRALRQCLERGFPGLVRLFPLEIDELGGTTNSQAVALTGIGHPGFVHVELSRAFRRRLREDPQALATLAGCLQP